MARVALAEIVLQAGSPATFKVGASVYVYDRGTENLAAIYSAEEGGEELAQPLSTDDGGRIRSGTVLGWVEEGSYDLAIGAETVPWEALRGEGKVDKAELDAEEAARIEGDAAVLAAASAAASYGSAIPATNLTAGHLYFQFTPAQLTRLFAGTLASEWNLSGVGEVEPTIVSENAKSGKAAKFKLTTTQKRSELILADQNVQAVRIREGQRYKYSFYVYVPVGGMQYGAPGKHNVIWQLHGGENVTGTILSLELGKYPTGGEQKGLYVSAYKPGEVATSNYFLGEFKEGELHQIVVEFTASERSAGAYKISMDGKVLIEQSGIKTVDPSAAEASQYGYIKTGIYRGSELTGTSELFVSQVEFEELSNSTVKVWLGQSGGVPTVVGLFQAPSFSPALIEPRGHTETFGSVSVAAGTTVSVVHGLKLNGEKVVPKAIEITPQNTENALTPVFYVRQVNETEFEIRNGGSKTFTFYWVAKI